MIDESNTVKKSFMEKPETYLLGLIFIIVIGVGHYQHNSDKYDQNSDRNLRIKSMMDSEKKFLENLKANQCYAVDVVMEFENNLGYSVGSVSNTSRPVHIRPVNFLLLDGHKYKLKTVTFSPSYVYVVNYFPKQVKYHCLKGGISYSTPYYFKSQDFKNLSEYHQVDTAEEIKRVIPLNKTVQQPIFNECYKGQTILFANKCASE